jgi:DNA excision repair protein ERCC-3
MRVLHLFQTSPLVNTLFLSKVGDTSIDLPEATCLIQISSHYGSRRQEAQRLGRILRAKRRNDENFSAFFYSLVSRDTEEMFYSTKRQQFLVDQGYSFKVINDLVASNTDKESVKNLAYSTHREQLELLQSVLLATEEDDDSKDEMQTDDMEGEDAQEEVKIVRRRGDATSIRSISGAEGMAYIEYNRPVTSSAVSSAAAPRHPLFKARFGSKG